MTMSKKSDPQGDQSQLLPPTYDGLLKKYKELSDIHQDIKSKYVKMIEEIQHTKQTNFNLSQIERQILSKLGKGSMVMGLKYLIKKFLDKEEDD